MLRKCLGSFLAWTTVNVDHSDLAPSWHWFWRTVCTEAAGEQWVSFLLPAVTVFGFTFTWCSRPLIYARELVKCKPTDSPSRLSGTFFLKVLQNVQRAWFKYIAFLCSEVWREQVFEFLRSASEHPQSGLDYNVHWISAIVFVVKVRREFCVGQPQHFWETSEGIRGVAKSSTPFDLNQSLVFLKLLKG